MAVAVAVLLCLYLSVRHSCISPLPTSHVLPVCLSVCLSLAACLFCVCLSVKCARVLLCLSRPSLLPLWCMHAHMIHKALSYGYEVLSRLVFVSVCLSVHLTPIHTYIYTYIHTYREAQEEYVQELIEEDIKRKQIFSRVPSVHT